MYRRTAALFASALVLAGCTGDPTDGETSDDPSTIFSDTPSTSGDASAAPSDSATASAPASTSDDPSDGTASEIDVTTTPDPITEEWAEAVINTLLAEYGDIVAEVLGFPILESPDKLPPDLLPRVEVLFDGEFEERRVDQIGAFATDLESREGVLPADEYEGPQIDLLRLTEATSDCIVVIARVDTRGSTGGGFLDLIGAWSMSPRPQDDTTNPTQWVIVDQLANTDPDGNELPDQAMLEASVSDFGASLENSCRDS